LIVTAFVLAVLLTIGFAILYAKLPKPVKNFIRRRYIIADIILCWSIFAMLGFAMIGIMTAAMVSIFVSGWLWWEKEKARDSEKKTVA